MTRPGRGWPTSTIRLAKVSTVAAALLGLALPIAAAIHAAQPEASYRQSPLIGVEIIGAALALFGILPQLAATIILLSRKPLAWGAGAAGALLLMIGGLVLAVALGIATIVDAT